MVRKQMTDNLPAPAQDDRGGLPADFHDLLEDVKARIRIAQTRAILAANAELVRLYWDIGRLIAQRKQRESWGAGVIPRLARELRNELPEVKGFSERNIKLMVQFAQEYPTGVGDRDVIGQPPVAQMQTVGKGQPLVAQIPWAHNVLLFYHLRLRAFVVIDLKKGKFKPEYAGKLNFYCNVVDDQLRNPTDQPTIGLILCQTKDRVLAEYALRGIDKPIGVSSYELTRALPASLKSALPTVEEIEAELAAVEPAADEPSARSQKSN